jgi:hypothetical protein
MGDDADVDAGVKVPGLEPTFRHVDDSDITWQQVKAIGHADGSVSSVWEKWLAFSPEPQYLSLYAKWDPGVVVRRHGHYSPHVLFVIEGDMWCGARHCPAGTHIELPLGDPRSWGDDPEAFQRALADRGAQALPDPEIELPEWLVDLRSRWLADGESGEP